MKLGHLSDLHIDERGRLADVQLVLDAFIDQVTKEQVDLVLVTGDVFERKSTAAERMVFADFVAAAAEVAPVVIVRGNHDAVGDLPLFERLDTRHWVHVADTEPMTFETFGLPAASMICLPWFDRAQLASRTISAGKLEAKAAAGGLLQLLATNVERAREAGRIPILAAHLMVGGSETSTGQLLIGDGVEVSPAALADTGAEYVALGHVHKTQEWYGGRVCYAGSPHRLNFGETEAKGWRLVEFDQQGKFLSNTFKRLPARERVLIEVDYVNDHPNLDALQLGAMNGALVRFRYKVRAQDLPKIDEDQLRAYFERRGVEEIKIEAVVEPELRARVPEIVECLSVEDKVRRWLELKGKTATDSVWDKLVALEGGV